MVWRSVLVVAAFLAAGCVEPVPAQDAHAAWGPAEDSAIPAEGEDGVPADEEGALSGPPQATPQAAGPAGARWTPGLHLIELPVGGALARGLLAVPDQAPTTLVLVSHGYGGDAASHGDDLESLADSGVLAVAMDYRGPRDAYKVRAGVEDTIAAAQTLQLAFPAIDRSLLYGWSMGGEVALLAAANAPPGTFDYVFTGAAVTDLETLWHENGDLRPAIERETGGIPAEAPEAYASRSPVTLSSAIAANGVARVFLVHGAADGPVPVEQAERMDKALVDAGQPVSYYVVTKETGEACLPETCVTGPALAGHGAGGLAILRPFIDHRIQRLPDPAEPAQRGTYDAETGEYEPSDVG